MASFLFDTSTLVLQWISCKHLSGFGESTFLCGTPPFGDELKVPSPFGET